jgi:hypothetical protein
LAKYRLFNPIVPGLFTGMNGETNHKEALRSEDELATP